MFCFVFAEGSKFVKNVVQLHLYLTDLAISVGFDLGYTGQNIAVVGLHLRKILIENLIMLVESTIEKRKVVGKFGFRYGDDVDQLQLFLLSNCGCH